MNRRAIVSIDLQNDYFEGGAFPLSGTAAAAGNAAQVLAAGRQAGDLIVHIQHVNADPAAPLFVAGSVGVEIHPSVAPLADEPLVVKRFPNAFRETALHDILTGAGVGEVVAVGAMSQMCVDSFARAAADFGFAVTVVHDACAARDTMFDGEPIPARYVHGAFMAGLAMAFARVVSTREFLAEGMAS